MHAVDKDMPGRPSGRPGIGVFARHRLIVPPGKRASAAKRPAASRRRRPSIFDYLRVLTLAVAFGSMVAATYVRLNAPEEARLAPAAAPRTNWASQLPNSIEAITQALSRLPIPLPTPQQRPRGAGAVRWVQRHYDVVMNAPDDPELVRVWFDTVEQSAPAVGARINQDANGVDVQIGVDGLLTHTLSLRWLGHSPRAAIILTELGNDLRIAREATELGVAVSFAIDPQRPFAREVAEVAKAARLEVLLALPAHSDKQHLEQMLGVISNTVGLFLAAEPAANKDVLRQLLAHAGARQLFAIDAAPLAEGLFCDAELQATSSCVTRDILLDAEADAEATRIQLESAITLVRTRGDVIVVASARPATLAALRAIAPAFATAQIALAPVSLVVADRRSLSAR